MLIFGSKKQSLVFLSKNYMPWHFSKDRLSASSMQLESLQGTLFSQKTHLFIPG